MEDNTVRQLPVHPCAALRKLRLPCQAPVLMAVERPLPQPAPRRHQVMEFAMCWMIHVFTLLISNVTPAYFVQRIPIASIVTHSSNLRTWAAKRVLPMVVYTVSFQVQERHAALQRLLLLFRELVLIVAGLSTPQIVTSSACLLLANATY